MTKALIQKNISLSLEFDRFISKHPSALKGMPRGASLVITSSTDKKLTDANLMIARNSRSRNFFEAHKTNGSWTIRGVK